MAERSW